MPDREIAGVLTRMGAAQDLLSSTLRDDWAPFLRERGFQGSGRIFTLRDQTDWAMLGFQTSTGSTGDEAIFTINLMVAGKAAWDAAREKQRWLPARPSPNSVSAHRYQQRIGFLTHGRDHWWSSRGDGSNHAAIVGEVLNALDEHAIPTLPREMADQSPGPRGTFAKHAT